MKQVLNVYEMNMIYLTLKTFSLRLRMRYFILPIETMAELLWLFTYQVVLQAECHLDMSLRNTVICTYNADEHQI